MVVVVVVVSLRTIYVRPIISTSTELIFTKFAVFVGRSTMAINFVGFSAHN